LRLEMVVRLVGLHLRLRRTETRAISPPARGTSTLRTGLVASEEEAEEEEDDDEEDDDEDDEGSGEVEVDLEVDGVWDAV